MPGPSQKIELPVDLKQLFGDYKGAAKDLADELKEVRKEARLAEKEGRTAAASGLRIREAQLQDRREEVRKAATASKTSARDSVANRAAEKLTRGLSEFRRVTSGGLRLEDLSTIQRGIGAVGKRFAQSGSTRTAMALGKVATGVGTLASGAAAVAVPVAVAASAVLAIDAAYKGYQQQLVSGNLAQASLQGELGKVFMGRLRGGSLAGADLIDRAQKRAAERARTSVINASLYESALNFLGYESGTVLNRQAEASKLAIAVTNAEAQFGRGAFNRGKFFNRAVNEVFARRRSEATLSGLISDYWKDFWSAGGYTSDAVDRELDKLQQGAINAAEKNIEDRKNRIARRPDWRVDIQTRTMQARNLEAMVTRSFGDWSRS